MFNRGFKIARIVISAAVFLAFAAAFSGFFVFAGVIAKEAFFPAWQSTLLGVFSILGVIAASLWGFALIAGRAFCSFGCPLGFLQDIAGRIGHLRRRPYRKQKAYRIFHYTAAALLWGLLLGGGAALFGWIEPYSLFGKFFNALVRPLIQEIGNRTGWWAFSEINLAALPLMILSGLLLLLILAAAVWNGRIFCNTLCPVGALLGFVSLKARFRLRFTPSCIGCKQCERVCKAGCIDVAQKKVDEERCVLCGNCQAICKKGGLTRIPEHRKTSDEERHPAADPMRRKVLKAAIPALAAGFLAGRIKETPKVAPGRIPVVPPGAGSLQNFLKHCTGCQLCVANCSGKTLAVSASGQVHLSIQNGFCDYNCNKCSNLCPTGALVPLTLAEKRRTRIGIASYFRERCVVVTDETDCGACAEHCPTGALMMVDYKGGLKIPKLTPQLCIGCGACNYICPVRPVQAVVVNGVEHQVAADDPQEYAGKEPEKKSSSGDFPF